MLMLMLMLMLVLPLFLLGDFGSTIGNSTLQIFLNGEMLTYKQKPVFYEENSTVLTLFAI